MFDQMGIAKNEKCTVGNSNKLNMNGCFSVQSDTGICGFRIRSVFAVLSMVCLALVSCNVVPCDNSGITAYDYMMAFQSCSGDDCSDPRNHMIYLAGSDDGISWTLIDDFEPVSGSVPDLVYYNNFLYIFHTQGASWQKLNACFQVVEEGFINLKGDSSVTSFVDPSLIVDEENVLNLFFLPGSIGGDPAGCGGNYPCTKSIYSAKPDSYALSDFSIDGGPRVSQVINESDAIQLFCDPDIIELADGKFLLYISTGGSTIVFQSDKLDGTYVSPDAPQMRAVSTTGGVPSAIQAAGGQVWLYVNKNIPNGGTSIARGVSPDGLTAVADENFSVVVDENIFDDAGGDISVGSPSVIEWPDENWSTQPSQTGGPERPL